MATNETINDAYMTTEEAATYIGFTSVFLKARRQRGGGPRYIAVGSRAVRYRRADLDAWMEVQARTSTSDPGPNDGIERAPGSKCSAVRRRRRRARRGDVL